MSLSALAPLVLLIVAACAILRPGRRPHPLPLAAEGAALAALALCLGGVVQVIASAAHAGALVTLGPVTATLAALVAFVGWIVLRYARRYLDGEAREGAFHGWMLVTLAAALVIVQAGNLFVMAVAFVVAGAGLRRLLLFYPERSAARRAAAKFSLVWHGGDVALLLAALILLTVYGTADVVGLSAATAFGLGAAGHVAVALLVVAAACKTAAFPLHGWLTEVMEAPTPVSALLHAGLVNAGGVLLIRNADLLQASPGAMAALVMLGGFTALYGAVVMLTQSAVKTALAWSTVSQMGFMLLQCGLGLWHLAVLHIVAHSLYKAHAFLSSGGAVRAVAATRAPGPVAVPDLGAVARAFALAVAVYAGVALLFGLVAGPKPPQALALGAILIFGTAYLVAQGLADAAPEALTRRTGLAALGAAAAYFGFQLLAVGLWGPSLPPTPVAGPLEWALVVLAVASFGVVAVAQTLFPLWAHHPVAAGLRVHLANGLYVNAVLDRLIGGFRMGKA